MGQVLDVNVRGVFSTIQLFVPFLEKAGNHQDPSRILITGSIIALRIGNFGIGTYGYLASKAAVHHLGEGLAVELGPRNITVNVLSPSVFPSEMSNGLLGDSTSKFADANPRRRLGEKQDIVAATVYLLSPGGSYINGAVLPIDGGAHLT
jgi:NAD(P)-dependent dehydrogenase (short-subunit alcohol dehydrogenase family)